KETKKRIDTCDITPEALAKIVKMVDNNTINAMTGKQILREVFVSGIDPEAVVKEKNLIQISDNEQIGTIIDEILKDNPQAVSDYKSGKQQALGFLVGRIMKQSGGKVNPSIAKQILQDKLDKIDNKNG
ncbi:MAG TPA: Asp-tRNA(Asn)/Glu-tRNA(Gln) amidotransferase GatCAB subunit B, partial [bacterium]|nr:Asp-tRNA(Asn)/Glu-tRNA(Gln) amidotransferase GatCAB subunit B [bacterium]